MKEANNCEWQMWDVSLTANELERMLLSLKNPPSLQEETEDAKDMKNNSISPSEEWSHGCQHVALVNVDLTAESLQQIVDKWIETHAAEKVLSVCLDDNALGEKAAGAVCKFVANAPLLRARNFGLTPQPHELSLQNVGMTDAFLSRLIGRCAQLEKNRKPLKASEQKSINSIDARNNGLLTYRASLSLSAGKRFLPESLTILTDLLPAASHNSLS
ncbi:hypothetical protein, conserved [Eimeria tenella]|uniref:PI-PLC Y-box domain-containing protein n=1 Tax=Eimeria tenella TaxID=5802 RepID=U6KWH3_EIMTE|nr:hypothetical protein, conserved [Eimeria tenella]CDJ41278.1 hypothetical protein, conserved [Eimeria tenella]|eukprot:XP_013232028.1 hypothetical protein, conserved [Eimeria tenella]